MITDYLTIGLRNLAKRRLRSWLTMIGIFIGIAAVVALISLGQGLQAAVSEQFEQLGSDKVFVQASVAFAPPGTFLNEEDKLKEREEEIISKVRGVDQAIGYAFKQGRLIYDDELQYQFVFGIPHGEGRKLVMEGAALEVSEGRDLKPGDKYKVVVGHFYPLGKVFQDENIGVGDKLEIEGHDFDVIGVLDKIGNNADDSSVMINYEVLDELFEMDGEYSIIMAKAYSGEDPVEVAKRIEKELRKERGLEEGEENFSTQTTQQYKETFDTILIIVQAVFIGIAGISLLVGGIGITNTMYTAVLQRRKEIGIMKSVGARKRDILSIFMIESALLGLAGGIIGVLIGMGMSKFVEYLAADVLNFGLLQATFPPALIIGALVFSMLVGVGAGSLPALQAANMQPVEALRK